MKFGLVAAVLAFGFLGAGGGVREAAAEPAACNISLQAGSPFGAFQSITDGACLMKIAEHNKSVWSTKASAAVSLEKHAAEAEVRRWEHAFNMAAVVAAKKDLEDVKKAGGNIAVAETKLHAVLDKFDADAARHATEITARLNEHLVEARKKASDLEAKWKGLAGAAKDEAELDMHRAVRAVKRAEHVLMLNELASAERRVHSSLHRVGAQAAALQAKARADYNAIKARLEGGIKKAENEVKEVEGKIRGVAGKLGRQVGEIKDVADHVAKALENPFGQISHLFSF